MKLACCFDTSVYINCSCEVNGHSENPYLILPSSVIGLFFPVPTPQWMKEKITNPPKNVQDKKVFSF